MQVIIFLASFLMFSSIAIGGECRVEAEAFIGVLEFEITNCNVKGDLNYTDDLLTGFFEVELSELDTGLSLRNEHMRDKYLETSKYPKAMFKLDPLKIGSKEFTGNLSLHGKTKALAGKVVESSTKTLKTEFKLDLTEYGIEIPEYKGITIAKYVTVRVTVP